MSERGEDEEDEEEDVIYHGTELSIANNIFGIKSSPSKMEQFFAATRELAFTLKGARSLSVAATGFRR